MGLFSKPKVTVGYKFYAGASLTLAKFVSKILRISIGEKIAWEGSSSGGAININKPELFGKPKGEGGVTGLFRFERGEKTQNANSYLAARIDGGAPANRGVSQLVLEQPYMGNQPYMRGIKVRAERVTELDGGAPQWYPEKAAVPISRTAAPGPGNWPWKVRNEPNFVIGASEEYEGIHFANNGWWHGNIDCFRITKNVARYAVGYYPVPTQPFGDALTDIHYNNVVLLLRMEGPNDSTTITDDKGHAVSAHMGAKLTTARSKFGTSSAWFDGVNSYMLAAMGADQDLGGAWTMEAWVWLESVRETSPSTYGRAIFGYGQLNIGYFDTAWFCNGNRWNYVQREGPLGPGDQPYLTQNIGPRATVGRWAFVSVCFDGNNYWMHQDGQLLTGSESQLLDINPAHLIRESLMNTEWGYGYAEEEIGNDSFAIAADKLRDEESFGLSYFWDDDSDLADVLNKVLDHVDGNLYVDYDTLKWTFTLNRKDYDEADLIELRDSVEVTSISNYKKPQFMDLVNRITINYYDISTGGEGTIIVSDSALFLQQGVKIEKSIDYKMISDRELAGRVAKRELLNQSQPLASCEILCTYEGARTLRRGSVFKLTAAKFGFNQTVMRVKEINRGDGKTKAIKIKCTEDVFDLPIDSDIQFDGVIPVVNVPQPIVDRKVTEAPYALLIQQYDAASVDDTLGANPGAGYLRVAAKRPLTASSNFNIAADAGSGYVVDDTATDYCPTAKLLAAINKETTSFTVTDMDDVDELEGSVLMMVDDEIMAFGTFDTGSGAMTLVLRGVWDTLPADHAAGATVFFIENWMDGPTDEFNDGEALGVKLLTNVGGAQLALDSAPIDAVIFDSRAIRPYPPANVRFGPSTYFPSSVSGSFTVNWSHRNRVLQQDVPLSWKSASVTTDPYKNTRYTLGFYDATDTLLVEREDIGTPTAAVTLNYTGNVTMRLKTVTDDGESLYTFEHVFAYTPPGGSPVNTITADTYTETKPTWIVDGNG